VFQIGNPKFETNSKLQFSKFETLDFDDSYFGIRACFGLVPAGRFARASNLRFASPALFLLFFLSDDGPAWSFSRPGVGVRPLTTNG
jgi:hypothetical protein